MKRKMKTLGIIPARYASTRFPGKPLVQIKGKSMIQRVYEQVAAASLIQEVVVATDDERIFEHVKTFGGRVEMTATTHHSGTDRCAEIAAGKGAYDLVVNIQGDEPFIDPRQIDQVIQPLLSQSELSISTLAKRLKDHTALFDPNIVKVVFGKLQQALYFSRSPVPYLRGVQKEQWPAKANYYKHLGIYAFRRAVLLKVAQLPPGVLEQYESLEQLRWLEAGFSIHVGLTKWETLGIDRPEDLEKISLEKS